MKLRLLNASHSYLAYEGQRRGFTYVQDAIMDTSIRSHIQKMWQEAIPTLGLESSFDVMTYCEQLLARFENPKIFHRLEQIAMDGSQKIPLRILATIKDCKSQNLPHGALLEAAESWFLYCEEHFKLGKYQLSDPMSDQLKVLIAQNQLREKFLSADR